MITQTEKRYLLGREGM